MFDNDLRPVFISRKVGEDLKHKEIKPALINEQSAVTNLNVAGVMPAMLVTRVGISTNESMSIKELDQYSITAKVNIHREK